MYLLTPEVFGVQINYVKEDILGINIDEILCGKDYDTWDMGEQCSRKDIVIGVSLPNLVRYRWVRAKKEIEDYAKKKGVTVKIENADYDEAKQASQVENLISQGIDVLVVAPVNTLTAGNLVEKAHKAGIKMIAYDRLIEKSKPDLYIAFSNITIGELQGRYLVESVPKGNYIIIYGSNYPKYKEGAMGYIRPLADKGDIKIIAEADSINWDPKIAYKVVKDVLDENIKIDAILAPNDATAGAAIEALETKGLAGKVVVTGQDADLDAVKRIIERTQSMTIFKDIRKEAKTVIDVAVKIAKGEEVVPTSIINSEVIPVQAIFITPIVIDKDNVQSVLIDSGYYKLSEIYRCI